MVIDRKDFAAADRTDKQSVGAARKQLAEGYQKNHAAADRMDWAETEAQRSVEAGHKDSGHRKGAAAAGTVGLEQG